MTRRRIGEWTFDAASGELSRGSEVRRLEPRAARTLELLIEANGGLVTQETIIAEVWQGRSVSDNSVPVVISQLRRALDDDARRPALIETVPKRGYRIANGSEPRDPRRGRSWLWLLALALALGVAIVGWRASGPSPEKRVIAVSDVINATGEAAYDPLARATSELIVTQLFRRGFDVRRAGGEADLKLAARLVMWNGAPSLGLTATDARGVVRWSGMTNGTPAQVPNGVTAELDRFERRFPPE